MDSYIKKQLKRKVSSFILSEAGKVGNRNTFSAAALVTASSFAAMMLSVKSVRADVDCGPEVCVPPQDYCCIGNDGVYSCSTIDESGRGDVDICWYIGN